MVIEMTVDLTDIAYEATGYDVAEFINIIGGRYGLSVLVEEAAMDLNDNGVDLLKRIIEKYEN